MRVEIFPFSRNSIHETVEFVYGKGRGLARLKSKHDRAASGGFFDVEMDIDCPLEFGKNAKFLNESEMGITIDEQGNTVVVMRVEGREEDGVIYGRLGQDCLVVFGGDTDARCSVGDWVELRLRPHNILLTVIGI